MKQLIAYLLSIFALSMLLLPPSLTSAYDLNQEDQALLQEVYTKINKIKQTKESLTTIHAAIQKVLPNHQGRSYAILDAIVRHIEKVSPHLRNYDGRLTTAQLAKFKKLPAVGSINAPYLLLEYSDIQCPFCEKFMSSNTIIDFVNSHPGAIKKTFRHYPLAFHQDALPAAIASECINQEFGLASMYPYIRTLMKASDLTDETIKQTAESLNLWNQSIATCISEEMTKKTVQDQLTEGAIFNVTGTPSSIILDLRNGKRIKVTGAVPLMSFSSAFSQFTKGTYKTNQAILAPLPTPQPTPTPPQNNMLEATQLSSLLADLPIDGTLKEILIIEYADMQCPYCQRQVEQKSLETVAASNPGKVSITFQHFPLSFHANAQPAAEAAECVKQETTEDLSIFYSYLHELFTVKDLTRTGLIDAAVALGVDMTTMETCLDNHQTANKVTQQMTRGQTLFGAKGTPANILLNTTNGKWILVSGAQQPAAFQNAIDTLLMD